ncbi:Hypothetical predicted protein, partial [Mytilus galloprovincialis]
MKNLMLIVLVLFITIDTVHPCRCTSELSPVCSTRGKTFRNSCYLFCAGGHTLACR